MKTDRYKDREKKRWGLEVNKRKVTDWKPGEASVEKLLGKLLAFLNSGLASNVLLVLVQQLLVVRTAMLLHYVRSLHRFGLQLLHNRRHDFLTDRSIDQLQILHNSTSDRSNHPQILCVCLSIRSWSGLSDEKFDLPPKEVV